MNERASDRVHVWAGLEITADIVKSDYTTVVKAENRNHVLEPLETRKKDGH